VAANVLAGPLRAGGVWPEDLAAVQRRREWPTRIIQALQSLVQRRILATARVIAFGVWPVRVRN
jgi:hypothetical protein